MQHLLLALVAGSLFQQPLIQTKTPEQAGEQKVETPPPELSEATRLTQEVLKLYNENKYIEALPLAKRCLELREKALGRNHELVATALNNLAGIYIGLKRYSDAEPLYKLSLTILESKFGKDSNYLTNTIENLALTYFAQRNNGEAEKLYLRALAIKELRFGAQNSETTRSLDLLGKFYERTDRFQKAADYYKRSLAIKEAALGPNDPIVAESLDDCACALILNDQPADAKQYQERASTIRSSTEYETIRDPRGVLQGNALQRVEPEYPAYAKQTNVRGTVVVEVTVDECGKVIDARVISGPRELREASVAAARGWRFSRTLLGGRPVKVIGSITFNFRI